MGAVEQRETIREAAQLRPEGLERLRRFLASSDGADVVDRAVWGALPMWEADELLEDFVWPGFLQNAAGPGRLEGRRVLGRLIDEMITTGQA